MVESYYQKHKEIIKKRSAEWVKKNPEKRKEISRRWYHSHKDKALEVKERFKKNNPNYEYEYYHKHKEARDNKVKLWVKNNRGKRLAIAKKWRDNNPDKMRDYAHIRRARIHYNQFEQIDDNEIFNRDGWICQLCHKKVNKRLKYPHPLSATIDHIIPVSRNGNHTKDNVHLAHLICNQRVGIGGVKQTLLFGI